MSNITVGCKLPNGLLITVGQKSVVLAGANSSKIIGGYGMTQVDKAFFDAWKLQYANYGPLKTGVIFEQDTQRNAEAVATERGTSVKTGLERLNMDKILPGVTKADYFDTKAA